jgi:hypothetical protein
MKETMRFATRAPYIDLLRARTLGMPLASRGTWRASDGGRGLVTADARALGWGNERIQQYESSPQKVM